MIDQENSSAWGQHGLESAAPPAYNYPLSPKLGLFMRLRGWGRAGSLGRKPPRGASVLRTRARSCPGMFGVLLFLGLSFWLGSVCLRLPHAERGVQGGHEHACTSPSPASIAPCGADPCEGGQLRGCRFKASGKKLNPTGAGRPAPFSLLNILRVMWHQSGELCLTCERCIPIQTWS